MFQQGYNKNKNSNEVKIEEKKTILMILLALPIINIRIFPYKLIFFERSTNGSDVELFISSVLSEEKIIVIIICIFCLP